MIVRRHSLVSIVPLILVAACADSDLSAFDAGVGMPDASATHAANGGSTTGGGWTPSGGSTGGATTSAAPGGSGGTAGAATTVGSTGGGANGGATTGGVAGGGSAAGAIDGGVADSGMAGARRDGGSADGATTVGASDGGSTTGGGFIRGPEPSAQALTKDGPYKVMSATSGFRNGPNFAEATLWWPTDAEPPFASVAVAPGWVSTENDIKTWGPFLASYGIVVLTIGTNSPITDLPPDRAKALLDALETLRAENTRSGSPLNGKLDTSRQATMGWSMGGGGSLLAGEQTPTLKAVVSMCGWNPGYDYGKVKVPALMFASRGDALAGGQSQGFYMTIPESTPKLLWEIDGGNHYFFNTPKENGGVVGRYGLSWLKVHLEGDTRYMQFLKQVPASKTDFRTNLK